VSDSAAPITVIIPCLNAEETLCEALQTVFAQTVTPLEVLVIDDGSRDRSVQVAKSFGPRVLVLRNPGRGPGAARKQGVLQARGTYIAFVDADDRLAPAKHERQLAILENSDEHTLVHTGSSIFGSNERLPPHVRAGGELATGRCARAVFEHNPMCGASAMLRKSLILKLGNFDADLFVSEDYSLWLRASTCCEFVYLPDVLYHIRRHDRNITHRLNYKAYSHWTAQDRFRHRHPEAFAQLPQDSIREYMVEPVLRAAREAYWRRDGQDYGRLIRLAYQLAPDDPQILRLWQRRRWPMAALRLWDRLTATPKLAVQETP